MCEYLGYEVKKLKRTRIMNVSLAGLKYGDWRELTKQEIDTINKLVQTSSKTEEASQDNRKKKNFGRDRKSFTKRRKS
jgi:23S rRNA pseudouridine2604 synthase